MRNLTQEQKQYNKQDATYSVYYDLIKSSFLKSDWSKLKNKNVIVMTCYRNNFMVWDTYKAIREMIKSSSKPKKTTYKKCNC